MKISELIAELEAIRAREGDLYVKVLALAGSDEAWIDPDPVVSSNWVLL